MPDLIRQRNVFMALGLLPRLTVQRPRKRTPRSCATRSPRSVETFRSTRRSCCSAERGLRPALSVGIQDVGAGSDALLSTRYPGGEQDPVSAGRT